MQVENPPRLEFRWEVSSVPHRTTRPAELHFCGNPTIARILSANNPRELQFGVRLAF